MKYFVFVGNRECGSSDINKSELRVLDRLVNIRIFICEDH